MEQVRKFAGLLILLFLGIPTLFAITWAVGITYAVSQPDFLLALPVRISHELPVTADLLLEAADHPQITMDDEARTWLRAAAQADTTPGELMEEIGLLEWLRGDLAYSLEKIYRVLNGTYYPEVITLNLRPLKRAFEHEAIDRYFLEVVDNLPPCTPRQQAAWEAVVKSGGRHGRRNRDALPACRPDNDTLLRMAGALEQRDADMPNEVVIFDREEFQLPALNLLSIAVMFSVALFLIPAFFIALGSFVAEPMSFRSFKWAGLTSMVGGLTVVITAFLPKAALKLTSIIITWVGYQQNESYYCPPELVGQITDRIYQILLVVVDPLFKPVVVTALLVGSAGIVLCTIFFIARLINPREGRPPVPTS